VQVFDLWFDKRDRTELLKRGAFASCVLGKGEVTQCGRLLRSYWPEFLRRHVPLDTPQLAASGESGRRESEDDTTHPGEESEEPDASTSWLKKMVPRAPRLPTLFR
jgi:hypothetical protein